MKRLHGWLSAASILGLSVHQPASAETGSFLHDTAWALSGPCCGDSGHDVVVEPDGSFFIVGNYGALDLDLDGQIDLRSEGGHDAILMKGRPSGELEWVRAPRSPAMSFARLTVAPDRRGGAYVAGGFQVAMEFKSGVRITARGVTDGLLVRYRADGHALWARAIGGDDLDSIADAETDAVGNVFVAGTIRGAVDLDFDGRTDVSARTGSALLVASYDPDGALRWARVASAAGDVTAHAIAVSQRGAVYVAAHSTSADVDLNGDGRSDLSSANISGPFLARFDADGNLSRAFVVPGDARITKLALAANGDLLAAGATQGSVDLDADGAADVTAREGGQAAFVARYGGDGALAWVRSFRQKERLSLLDLTVSEARIAVGGLYKERLDLDHDGRPDAAADPDGESEGFVAMLDHGGAIAQILSITGPGADQVRGVAFSPDGRSLSVTGFVRLTADFDGDGVPEGGVRCDHYGDLVWGRYLLAP